MKLFLKIVLGIFVVFVLVAGSGVFYMSRGLDAGKNMIINSIGASTLNDGIYSGKYSAGRWSNEVSVAVKGHKIVSIDVVKDVTFSRPEVTKELFNRVIAAQNTKVDIVSGATVTSKAYLKSIENALSK